MKKQAGKYRFDGLEPSLESQRRRQLMRAVVECVSEEGFDKTTMRKVAERAGVSTGMLVYYFRNKRELVNAAMLDAFGHRDARINENTSSTFGPLRLEVLLNEYFKENEPGLPSVSFMLQVKAASLKETELRTRLSESFEASLSKLKRSIQVGIESGQFRNDVDPEMAADLIFGLMVGWSTEMAVCPDAIPPERAVAVSRFALQLITKPAMSAEQGFLTESKPSGNAGLNLSRAPSTADRIQADLLSDQQLSPETARELAKTFRTLYGLVVSGPHKVRTDQVP